MAYSKMSERHKVLAYFLNREFKYSMKKIGELMGVSQSTISNGIKDFKYQYTIKNLEDKLVEARNELNRQGFEPTLINLNRQGFEPTLINLNVQNKD